MIQNPTTKQKDTVEKRWAMICDTRVESIWIIAKYQNFQFAVVRLGAVSPGALGQIVLFFFLNKLETFLHTSHVGDGMKVPMVLEISSLENIHFSKISKI